MDIEKIIRKIIDDGDIKYMNQLSDMLEKTLEIVKKFDDESYKKYEMDLYKMAYGSNLNKEISEKIVNNMKPYGQKWSLEEIQDIQEQYGITDINPIDIYVVLNSAYNDYKNLFGDKLEMYVKFADDFINDEDANPDKVFIYFMNIPEK